MATKSISQVKDPILYGGDLTGDTSVSRIGTSSSGQPIFQARPSVTDLSTDDPGTWSISGSGTGTNAAGNQIGTSQPITQTTTSSFDPTMERPVMGDVVSPNLPDAPTLPTFESPELEGVDPFVAPTVDEDRISGLTQQFASPGIRTLRQALRESTSRKFDNPNVGALTLRKALQGYGTGVESIIGESSKSAMAQESSERATKTREAEINFNQAVQDRNAIFNADMHSADVNFQAAIDNIKMVYGNEVAAEMQTVAEQNAQNRTIFSTAMNEYLQTGTKTTTKTTKTGTGSTSGSSTSGGSGGTLDFQQRAWDAKQAAVNSLAYNNPMRNLAVAQLGTRPS